MDKVSAVAERLLEKETINVDDVVELIGPRPFPMPRTYADFMANSWEAQKSHKDDEIKEEGEVVLESTEVGDLKRD